MPIFQFFAFIVKTNHKSFIFCSVISIWFFCLQEPTKVMIRGGKIQKKKKINFKVMQMTLKIQ